MVMKREKLKELLPRGYHKTVADKAGVSVSTVRKYFANASNNTKIEFAVLEVLGELNTKRKQLIQKML